MEKILQFLNKKDDYFVLGFSGGSEVKYLPVMQEKQV